MIFGGSFGKNVDIITREMNALTLRNNVIANNIANADTPNFKRSDVDFETRLSQALESEKVVPFPQYITNPKDIPFDRPVDYRSVKPRRVLDYLTQSDNNGNNVDINVEGMNALENQLLYTTLAQAISSDFQRVQIVLK